MPQRSCVGGRLPERKPVEFQTVGKSQHSVAVRLKDRDGATVNGTASAAIRGYCGEHRYPPIVENRRAKPLGQPFRVVAFNARGGVRFNGILNCLKHEPLASAAIILLSEVDFETRRAYGRRVAAELARHLGMSVGYVPEFGLVDATGEPRAYLGNAILSAYPLEDIVCIDLPRPLKRRFRRIHPFKAVGGPAALSATIEVGRERLRVCVAHLDSRCAPEGRSLQMAALTENLPAYGRAIIGGDLNTTTTELHKPGTLLKLPFQMLLHPRRFRWPERYEPLFERLREAGFEVRGANLPTSPTFTFSSLIPPIVRPRLDWIALRGIEPVAASARVVPARPSIFSARVSDHDFIVVDLDL